MKRWYDEEHDVNMCEPNCVDEWLFDIWAIGFDYDGENTVDGLKKCVDYLVEMSKKARECLWDGALFGIHGEPKPQTNADRIRAMSDEELMKIFESVGMTGCPEPTMDCRASCEECILDWLKQPVKDGEDDG